MHKRLKQNCKSFTTSYLFLIVAVSSILLVSCTSSLPIPDDSQSSPNFIDEKGLIDNNTHCTPGEIGNFVIDFFTIFENGSKAEISQLFGEDFMWYSMTALPDDHIAFVADSVASMTRRSNDRETLKGLAEVQKQLVSYLLSRQKVNEKVALYQISINGRSSTSVDIGILASRQADDLLPEKWGPAFTVAGKAQINCGDNQINVLSMSMQPKSQVLLDFCPESQSDQLLVKDVVICF